MKHTLMIVAAVFAANVTFADTFTYVDHWPSGTGDETATEVVVPNNTTATIADASDVAAVARLTSISFGGSAAKVEYTASAALALSANVSGSGTFSAISSGNLTLSGDNSGLVSPGCFFFSNMAVTVSSRYGLGSTGSATLHYWIGDKVDPLEFTGAGLTNDAPIRVHQGTANYNFVLGPKNADETLVIRNTIAFSAAGSSSDWKNIVFFRNKIRFQGGTFFNNTALLYSSALSGGSAEVWFEESVKAKFSYWFTYKNMTVHLNSGTLSGSLIANGHNDANPIAVCEADGVLNALSEGISGNGTFDLNGHDQSVKLFSTSYGRNITFKSAAPATLTLSSYNAADKYTSTQAKFSGAVNFTYHPNSSAATNTITDAHALSDSSGTLTVQSGTLKFENGAGWSGTNVVVNSGATLELVSDKSMTNTTATLTVDGKLVLRAAAVCKVKSATIAGTTLTAGQTYNVTQLKAMGLPVDGDAGGSIDLSSEEHVWSGWPTEPGATADVPENMTIYVSDDDVPTIEALGGIRLRSGSSVICTNLTRQFALSADLVGSGMFQVVDSEMVVLSGDNSGLASPGYFFFSNTAVTVTSRYGLGSSATGALKYWYGDKVASLVFVGAGLTNDVPMEVHQGTQPYNFVLGPTNANETLVIKNTITFDTAVNSSDWQKMVFFRNKIRFQGGTFYNKSANHLYSSVLSGTSAEVWFEESGKAKFVYWFTYKNMTVHLGGGTLSGSLIALGHNNANPIAVCEADGVLDVLSDGISGNGTFDLNGFEQSIRLISKQYGSMTKFTSETPATLSVTMYNAGANYTSSSAKFSGKVNFSYAPTTASGSYTLTGSDALSDSSGMLTVGGVGQLVFANGAGWCGTNVTIRSGATLSVDAASMPVAFGNRAVLGHSSRTKLEIEAGGTLSLAASAEPATVRTLVYDGNVMPAGLYTSVSGVGITGGGALRVRSSTDGEPGSMIIVY